jgi:hypothetical protein
MWKAVTKVGKEVTKPTTISTPTREASYSVRKTSPSTTTHEHSQANPILGKSPEKAYQHYTILEIHVKMLIVIINFVKHLVQRL